MTEHQHQHQQGDHAPAEVLVQDPVCGMSIDPATSLSTEHDNRLYHFCSERCQATFTAAPILHRQRGGLHPTSIRSGSNHHSAT